MMMHHAMMQGPMMAQAMLPTQMMMAAANPYMNPMHPMHPFNHEVNVQHDYMTPTGMYSIGGGSDHHSGDGVVRPDIKVRSHCQDVKKQALTIANTVMQKQNSHIFKKLMDYLLKSKYLIGMTEIKLTRKLRRNIFSIMKGYSMINNETVHFTDEHGLGDDSEISLDSSGDSSIKSLDASDISDINVIPDHPEEQLSHIENELE